jgi:hypothetical protein
LADQVFISYRHVKPDEDLAEALEKYLRDRRVRVFVDKRIQVGMDWVKEIDRQLRASNVFVVLLSEDSIRSDMVRQEIQTAYELLQQGKMRILPVRLGYHGDLPYDLAAYLRTIQYAVWDPGQPHGELCSLLHAAMVGDLALPEDPEPQADDLMARDASASSAVQVRAPLPAADPRPIMERGTIRLDSPFYVRRWEDGVVERQIGLQGTTVVIKGPRQSGKSSLLARALALARKNGQPAVYLSFQSFDASQLRSLKSLLTALALQIGSALRSTVRPEDIWDSKGDKLNFESFLEAAVLSEASRPVVLLLDEVDRIFDQRYRSDFFSGVRVWTENRATKHSWINLNLVLSHSTDPALWIDNLHESPFNVGERLRLGDFNREQVQDLNARYGSPLPTQELLDGLLELVGGHPYLIRQALYVLATERWLLEDLRRVACKDSGPFGDHLRRHLWALLQNRPLLNTLAQIVRKRRCDNENHFQRLLATGLIAGDTRAEVQMRCALYQIYFSQHL